MKFARFSAQDSWSGQCRGPCQPQLESATTIEKRSLTETSVALAISHTESPV